MRVLVNDFARYSFIVQLSRALAQRGFVVDHSYCVSQTTTPEGNVERSDCDDQRFQLRAVELSSPLQKYSLLRRRQQEIEYGIKASKLASELKPDVVLSANTPLDAQRQLWKTARLLGAKRVFWLQDIIGLATYRILRRKLPGIGHIVGAYYMKIEERLLRSSDAIVTISPRFSDFLSSRGVPLEKVHVQPNWAPLDEVVPKPKDNDWSRARGLQNRFVFLYSGTLSMKHNPELLLDLARAVGPEAAVVVRSQGSGADWLRERNKELPCDNLVVEPYGPYSELSTALGAADVLVAVLENEASEFSVPSKVLTYMCAGRPILLAIPGNNDAAEMVSKLKLGLSCEPSDRKGFVQLAKELLSQGEDLVGCGRRAREAAEKRFEIAAISNVFLDLLNGLGADRA